MHCTGIKTLIGTKSNRLRLLGQGAERALTCSPSQLSIQGHWPISLPPFFLVTIFDFAFLSCLLCAPHVNLVWYGLDMFRHRMSTRVPTENDNTFASCLRTYFYPFLLQVNTPWTGSEKCWTLIITGQELSSSALKIAVKGWTLSLDTHWISEMH